MNAVPTGILVFGAVLALLALRDYLGNERRLTPRARIWLRIAIIFGAMSAWLWWSR